MNEVQTKETHVPTTLENSKFSAADQISASDITIPRLKIMQTNSDLVKEDKAKAGSIIDTDTLEVYGYKSEKPFEFVVLASRKFWLEKIGDQWSSRPAVTKFELPWKENGIERTFFHSFLVVSKKDLQEKNSFLMPMQLSFSSTGLNTVSTISKIILQGKAMFGKPSYGYYMKADIVLRKKGTNSWFQMHCVKGNDLTATELKRIGTIPLEMIMEASTKNDTKVGEPKQTSDDGEY